MCAATAPISASEWWTPSSASPRCRQSWPTWRSYARPSPSNSRLDLEHGGRTVRLIHVGGHTEATILIWLPEEKVLFAGDTVWSDQHPYMAQANSKQWLEGLSYIRKLHPASIVPGHGPVTTIESTEPLSEYIRYVRRQVRVRIRRGYTKQETASSLVKSLVPMFPVPSDRRSKIESQIKQGINRVYNEYKKGTEPSRPDPDDEDEPLDIDPDETPAEDEPLNETIEMDGADRDAADPDTEFEESGDELDQDDDDFDLDE
ncbi:MAG: MBL fold metallo-hydrolase [Anaerolineae bacterium]